MKLKQLLLCIFLLFPSVSSEWPIPKVIASGKGMQIVENKLPVSFLWFVGISLSEENNVYALLPIHNNGTDRNRFESSGIDVIFHDNESIFIKIVLETNKMDSRQITRAVIKKLESVDSRLMFFLDDSTLYVPRP